MMTAIDMLVFLDHNMDFQEELNLFDIDWLMVLLSVIFVDYNHDHLFQHNKFLLVLNQSQNDDHVVEQVENEL
jgi:hypothetical protein